MSAGRTAVITGASRGLGLALARALAADGWSLVIDARGAEDLERAARELAGLARERAARELQGAARERAARGPGELAQVRAIAGDVADAAHRSALVDAAGERIDLLVNNASILGPSPQPALADYPLSELAAVLEVNVLAPLALIQLALPRLAPGGAVVNVTSDAAVEPYPGWGGYGSSKAALEQLTAVLAAEHPVVRVYGVDPGDMRTRMHQQAFPGEDISDRPPPEESVPGILALIEQACPSGRYRARELSGGGARGEGRPGTGAGMSGVAG